MNLVKFRSRKFLAFLGAVLIAIGGILTGEVTVLQGLIAIVTSAVVYMGAEGAVDVARANKNNETE